MDGEIMLKIIKAFKGVTEAFKNSNKLVDWKKKFNKEEFKLPILFILVNTIWISFDLRAVSLHLIGVIG